MKHSTSDGGIGWKKILVILAAITGSISFGANISTILVNFGILNITVGTVNVAIPRVSFSAGGIISDPSVAFAEAFYANAVLLWLTYELIERDSHINSNSSKSLVTLIALFLSFVVPPMSAVTWMTAYFNDESTLLLMILAFSNLWIFAGAFSFQFKRLFILFLILLFPVNALYLTSFMNAPEAFAWGESFSILAVPLLIMWAWCIE